MENKKDKGFTLVELLIVIVILGILATITVFAVRGITDQGQTSACESDKKTMQTAAEAYFAQYGGDTIAVTLGQQTPAYSRPSRLVTPRHFRLTPPTAALRTRSSPRA